ncbi:MAG: hypothetical protein K9J06_06170 [Flavobacteriales bacterium]|nr:hypothetical protein [Flavobacteriales bacterium]
MLKLLKAGLPSELIVTKIRSSITHFDVTMDDLMKLSSSGVPAEIMQAMIDPKAKTAHEAVATNDSISICKKWKKVSTHKNGVLVEQSDYELIIQYHEDGTWHTSFTNFKTNKSSNFGGTYEFSDDRQSITTYPERGESSTSEIVKLTNTELETKSSHKGEEYITLLISIDE